MSAALPLLDPPALAVGDLVRSTRGNVGEVLALQDAGAHGRPGRLVAIVRARDGRVCAVWPRELTRLDAPEADPAEGAAVRIARPGVYRLPPEAYHADPCPAPSLSSSLARLILARSPAHAKAACPRLTPHPDQPAGAALDRGAAAHELLFGFDEDRLEVVQAASWRGAKARAARAAARARGRAPILAHQLATLTAMVRAARAQLRQSPHPEAFDLAKGEAELSVCHAAGGIWQRARFDWLSHDRRLLLDYKTTARSIPDWLRWHFDDALLAVQAAHYRRAARSVLGITPRFAFVVQETRAPYALAVVTVPPARIDAAERRLDEAVAAWRRGVEQGEWPGYSPASLRLAPPNKRRPPRPQRGRG